MELTSLDKVSIVLDHIQNVQRNCNRLGLKIMKNGDVEFGRMLIANGQMHDNSKFKGLEFKHLFYGDPFLPNVASHHATTNAHHPEHWNGIQNMPDIALAEMVCDCAARSSEQGTNLREWFAKDATTRYNFKMDDEVGIKLTKYIDLLLAPPFKPFEDKTNTSAE